MSVLTVFQVPTTMRKTVERLGIIAFPQAAARAGGVGDVLTVTGLILPK
jgi:hypothetical protein